MTAVPTGYTGGEEVAYWDGSELVQMRMVDDTLETAVRAAETLKARFFFKVIGYDHEQDLPIWGAFDRHTVGRKAEPGRLHLRITVAEPTKTFTTDDTAPLIMWAAAKGGG